MKMSRLEGLADGIFAIVMTLLVLEIRVPDFNGHIGNRDLVDALWGILPIFSSYVLSFLVLFTYWIGHHFIISVCAKNVNRKLLYLNVPFLLLVALIPFSAQLLGSYPDTQVAIVFYGLNVIAIGLFLDLIRHYILESNEIRNAEITKQDISYGHVRVILPPLSAMLAILISFFSTAVSIYIFIFAIIFNVIPGVFSVIEKFGQIFLRAFNKCHS